MISNKLHRYRTTLERKKGRLEQIKENLIRARKKKRTAETNLQASKNALAIIQIVSQETQEEIKTNLTDIVSASQAAVFPNPYKFEVEFVPRRNKIELDMFFERNGKLIDPRFSVGFGAKDIASLSLLFTTHILKMKNKPNICNTLFMDEPLNWLKGSDYPERGAAMINKLSHEMGIQIVMTNHDPQLMAAADRIFELSLNDKEQTIVKTKEINNE